MDELDRIFTLALLNGVLSIFVGVWHFFSPVINLGSAGPTFAMGLVAILLGITTIMGGMLVKKRMYEPAWIVLGVCGVMTLPIGILGLWAATLVYNYRTSY